MTNDPESRMAATPHDKTRSADEQSPSGIREEFLSAQANQFQHQPDVIGVVVRDEGEHIALEFEDGERVVFDATELRAAIRAA